MKHKPFGIFAFGSVLIIALMAGCGKHEPEPAKAAEKSAEPESSVKHGTNGEAIITLDAETQKTMGLQTAGVTAAELPPEAKGYARVLDMSVLGGFITDLQAAQIAVDAARQELTRLRTLREQNNASEKALQTAESAAAKEENNFKAILIKIQAAWGKKLADAVATQAVSGSSSNKADPLPIQLFDRQRVLLRADFPPGEGQLAPESSIKLFGLADNSAPTPGQFFDYAPTADPQTQTRGIFCIAENAQQQFAAGMALSAACPTTGKPHSGVIVPREAVLRSEGKTWVYVAIAADKFTRREVTLDQLTDKGWLVTEGVKAQDKVVVAAAQELLSEELKEQ
jgi:hypothetical protein